MTKRRSLTLTVALLTVLALSSSVFAGQHALFLSDGATLAGQSINKGQYDLIWKKNGKPDSYDVRVVTGTKTVAKATATMVDRGQESERDTVITKLGENGTRQIQEIRFRGKTKVLVIDG